MTNLHKACLALTMMLGASGAQASGEWPDRIIYVGQNPHLKPAIRLFDNGDFSEAIAKFDKSIAHGMPSRATAMVRNYQCVAARELESLELARSYCEAALRLDGEYIPALINYGYVLKSQGLVEGATRVWCKAFRIAPDQLKGNALQKCGT